MIRKSRGIKLLFVFSFAAFFLSQVEAQHLPQGVRPEHYSLALTPDLAHATFAGEETIDIKLDQPQKSVVLNALDIQFDKVEAKVAGKTLPAEVSTDQEKEQATFSFPSMLPAGPVTLSIRYKGILNDKLRGFYLSKTEKRNYAVTQFEPTDARRAFPSFDEPAYKATFDIALTVDQGDTVISNTNIISDKPSPTEKKHTLRFATTPKMSTYLVAFLVGDFQCVSGKSDGVPIRACATPDKVQMGKYAVTAAEFILHYYNQYFGIKYPMPKLDMIALPDFEAGAMENFGAITYRETALLIDEKTASIGAKQTVASVVAHEMAHQWFGDMVTMQWWNNLWLNEGFATWMENKPVDAWMPEWKIPEGVTSGLNDTLNYDAQRQTRTIRAEANTPAQINEMFDGISYGKAGAVLAMVENYLGKETFRQGVHNYLAAHMYGNATAEDFWNAQTATSHKPVDAIMSSLVSQPGVPLIRFGNPANGKVETSQERFFTSVNPPSVAPQTWTIPVCFKAEGIQPSCEILKEAKQELSVPKAPLFFADAGGQGYYHYTYPAEAYAQLLPQVETRLTTTERINLLGNQWALTSAAKMDVGSYLDLAKEVKNDESPEVLGNVTDAVASISTRIAATEEERTQIAAWTRKTFQPSLVNLGKPVKGESAQKTLLRATLFGIVGGLGRDPRTIAEAKLLAEKYLADPSSVEPNLARTAVAIAARNGDAAFYDEVLKVSQTANSPEIASGALFTLTHFIDPALVARTLEYAVSGKVRNQDSLHMISALLRSPRTQMLTWDYIQKNWDKVQAQMTMWAGAELVDSASSFCSVDMRDQLVSYFSSKKIPAAERALSRMQDHINDCIDLRAAQEPKLKQWLETTTGGLSQ